MGSHRFHVLGLIRFHFFDSRSLLVGPNFHLDKVRDEIPEVSINLMIIAPLRRERHRFDLICPRNEPLV